MEKEKEFKELQPQKPKSETVQEQPVKKAPEEIVYRKFDSDDVVRIRGHSLTAEVDKKGKEHVTVNTGMVQKLSIVLGIKKCPWFSDNIDESEGINDEIFKRRMTQEFRRVPVDKIDLLFKESQAYNKADFNPKELQKN